MLQTRNDHLSISCVITAHNEGINFHTTLLSYEAMRLYAEECGSTVEWVIVLDAAEDETVRVAKDHPSLRSVDTLLHVNNRSLSKSRNEAIAVAKGDIIAVLNGGDYCTSDFLFTAAKEAARHPDHVVHPHHVVSFGAPIFQFWETELAGHLKIQNVPADEAAALLLLHPHVSIAVARKAVFEEIPYTESKVGLDFETWYWDHEVSSKGYKHTEAYGTCLFYRRLNDKMAAAYRYMPTVDLPAKKTCKNSSAEKYSSFSERILSRWKKWSARSIARWKRSLLKRLSPRPQTLSPEKLEALTAAGMELSPIDPWLHPASLPTLGPVHISPDLYRKWSDKFLTLCKECTAKDYDIVYVVPWIIAGGADLMILNQANACSRMGKKVLVIATECDKKNIWAPRLDKNITFLLFGDELKGLDLEVQMVFLFKLLSQIKPKHIHNINSCLCHKTFINYGNILKNDSQLCVSLYADMFRPDKSRFGGIVDFLRDEHDKVHKVVCDNIVIPQSWTSHYGVPLDNFKALYGFIPQSPLLRGDCTSPKVLWAGRICREKRPDILLEVAKNLPDMEFHIYGGDSGNAYTKLIKALENLPNVVMHGPYSGFESSSHFRLFLSALHQSV